MTKIYIPTDPTKHARAARSKYRNTKCKALGKKFDSVGERNRYFYLADAQERGVIRNLRHQVRYELKVNGMHICAYIADFVYEKSTIDLSPGAVNYVDMRRPYDHFKTVVEDYKGGYRLPPDWPIKQKLMLAIHGVDVIIVKEATARIV